MKKWRNPNGNDGDSILTGSIFSKKMYGCDLNYCSILNLCSANEHPQTQDAHVADGIKEKTGRDRILVMFFITFLSHVIDAISS